MITGVKKNTEEPLVKVVKNAPTKYDDRERVLLIDADSIVYTTTYFPDDGIIEFNSEEEYIEEVKFRIRNKIQEITNNVEEWYNIKSTLLFVGGKGNFRYSIYPDYKKNRRDVVKSEYFPIACKYIVEELRAIESHGAEADDFVIDCAKECEGNCVIASIDKDVLFYAPNIPIYDYRSHHDVLGEFKHINEKEARLARATQIITGDSTDGIAGAFGVGEAYCKKHLHQDMTDYQFIKQILLAYLKSNKGDSIKAKEEIRTYYKVLKLYTLEEIKQYI
jgi:5'-3' exonuclease